MIKDEKVIQNCFHSKCDYCIKTEGYLKISTNKPLVILGDNCSSNYHQRLICLLSSSQVGKIFSAEEIKEYVWVGKKVGESSVPQIIHHTRKFLPEGYDIVSFRGKGYFLYVPN